MKRTKPFKVSIHYSYEGYNGSEHTAEATFDVEAINYIFAQDKGQKLFKKNYSHGTIISTDVKKS